MTKMGAARAEAELRFPESRPFVGRSMAIEDFVLGAEWQASQQGSDGLTDAERSEYITQLEQGFYDIYIAIGEDPDGARNADELFGRMPQLGNPAPWIVKLVRQYRADMEAEADMLDAHATAAQRKLDRIAAYLEQDRGCYAPDIIDILNDEKEDEQTLEQLPLDTHPWRCDDGMCRTSRQTRHESVFDPQKGCEQDHARYEHP